MLKDLTTEIQELSKDSKFVRNLSLASILAIGCLFSLSDLQSQTTKASEKATITNMSQSTTRFIVGR